MTAATPPPTPAEAEILRRIAANVHRLRTEASDSHASLARACGLSATTIWVIERGTRAVSPETLDKVVRGLGLQSADELHAEPVQLPPPAGRNPRGVFTRQLQALQAEADIAAAGHTPEEAAEMYRILTRKLRLVRRTCA